VRVAIRGALPPPWVDIVELVEARLETIITELKHLEKLHGSTSAILS
jgi:hypothetical protein